MHLTLPFSRPPAGARLAHASRVTAEWGGCNGLLGCTLARTELVPIGLDGTFGMQE